MESFSRDLGSLEEDFLKANLICLTFAEIDTVLELEPLKRALDRTQSLYPNLRLNVDQSVETLKPRFRSVTGRVRCTSLQMDSSQWMSFLEAQQNSSFSFHDEMPLWEVYVVSLAGLEITKICISYHHCIGDGTSGHIILNDMLQNYQQIQLDTCNNSKNERVSLEFLPNVETLAYPSGILADEERAIVFKNKLALNKTNWKPAINFSKNGLGLSASTLDEIQADVFCSLKSLCKHKNATVGAVLIAALHFSVGILAKQNGNFHLPWKFTHDADANLRSRVVPPLGDEHLSLLIGIFPISLTLESEGGTFWEYVEQASKGLRNAINDGEPLLYHIANRLIQEEQKVLESVPSDCDHKEVIDENDQKEDGRSCDLNFSNMGQYKFDSKYDRYFKSGYCYKNSNKLRKKKNSYNDDYIDSEKQILYNK